MEHHMKRVSLTPAVFHLSDRVNAVCEPYARQPIVPRGPALQPLLERLRVKAADAAACRGTHETVIFTASGSGAIAAAVGSCIDERGVLVIVNDAYGQRQADFCEQLGIRTVRYELEWGVKPDLAVLEKMLGEHKVGTVGMVHGCTSVGLLNPLAEVGALCKRLGLRLIVDAIASLFVEEIDVAGWGISALICSTNKGLHSNPDLAFCLVAKDYLEGMAGRPGRIPYLDVYKTWTAQRSGGHPFTINVRALLEFEAALDDYFERGGLAARIGMYHERVRLLREGYRRLGLETFQHPGMAQQNIGTALYIPPGVSYQKLADDLAGWDDGSGECYDIYSAQGKLSDRVFRIFNMGEYPLETYSRFLGALEVCLGRQG
jgi:2-aminoethylphosphonate-pyruvate transaminase